MHANKYNGFSIEKILTNSEMQRKDKVKRAVDRKRKEMETAEREIHTELSNLLTKMAIQRKKETAERLAKLEAEEEEIAQQLELNRKIEFEKQRIRESHEISKKIIPLRESFLAQWKNISDVTQACRDIHSASNIMTKYSEKLNYLWVQMDGILEKAKIGDLSPAHVKMAEIVINCNDDIYQSLKAEIEEIDALYEKEIARREMELKQAELAAQQEAMRLKQIQELQNAAKESQYAAVQQEVRQELYAVPSQQVTVVDSATLAAPTVPDVQPAALEQTPAHEAPSRAAAAPVVQPAAPEQTPAHKAPSQVLNEYPDADSVKRYEGSQQFLANYVAFYQDFVKTDATKEIKDFKFQCQKTLNSTVNTTNSHSTREQLIDKYEKLRLFLSGKGIPNILLNPQAEAFSKSWLAQKIVDQADTNISSKPELAFPFAAIAVSLWNDCPDFGNLLLARIYAKSPFFVPIFLEPKPGQSEEEYYKSLGCKYSEAGTPENSEQFLKRLGGLMYLYASILVTKQRRGVDKPHPHGIENAWRWFAATINTEPRCDIADVCATLIYVFLEVAGNDLWKTYPRQFPKMLFLLKNVYYKKLKSLDTVISSYVRRLGDFLAKTIKDGSIPSPKGQLPDDFW